MTALAYVPIEAYNLKYVDGASFYEPNMSSYCLKQSYTILQLSNAELLNGNEGLSLK